MDQIPLKKSLPFLLELMVGHSISIEFFVMNHGFELVLISVDFCVYGSFSSHEASIWRSQISVDLFLDTQPELNILNATHWS